MTPQGWIVLIVVAYLAGSIPFGLLAGLLKGVDIRKVGSQNIGASNAGRVLGRHWFFIVLVLDALKGFVPVLVGSLRVGGDAAANTSVGQWWVLGVALAALLGHLFPVYLGFRGGRGVSTALGIVLAIWPYYTIPGVLAFGLWWVVKALSGYISVASISAAGAFPILVILVALAAGWPLGALTPLILFAVCIAVLVVARHWANIQRLRSGQELAPDRLSETSSEPAQKS